MIRPITCLAFLLACGSGLYLYQSKHRVKLLDEEIAQTVHTTDALREQIRMLNAEWTLLNDPERLRQLATQFLTLQTVSPNQFTSLATLDSRLPPPVPPAAPTAPADAAGVPVAAALPAAPPVADAAGKGQDEGKPAAIARVADEIPAPARKDTAPRDVSPAVEHDAAALPVRLATAAVPEQVRPQEPSHPQESVHAQDSSHAQESSHPQEHRAAAVHLAVSSSRVGGQPAALPPSAEQHGPQSRFADQRVADQRLADQRLADQRAAYQRTVERRVEQRPVVAVRVPAPLPQATGSLLGMAHGMGGAAPVPLPRPVPVSAPQWSYTNGG